MFMEKEQCFNFLIYVTNTKELEILRRLDEFKNLNKLSRKRVVMEALDKYLVSNFNKEGSVDGE